MDDATKTTAQKHALYAKRMGWIELKPCAACGYADPLVMHMHHEDYNKPLDIVWLCRKCHFREHGRLVRERGPSWRRARPPPPSPPLPPELQKRHDRIRKLLAESPEVFDFDPATMEVRLRKTSM